MEKKLLEETLATVHGLLQAEGMNEAASLVREHPARAEQTGYDNWNGGTEIWEVQFEVPTQEFARLGARRGQLEEQITARLKTILEHDTQDWYSARIVPAKVTRQDWRAGDLGFLRRQPPIPAHTRARFSDVRNRIERQADPPLLNRNPEQVAEHRQLDAHGVV